jgi:hypothetical protein
VVGGGGGCYAWRGEVEGCGSSHESGSITTDQRTGPGRIAHGRGDAARFRRWRRSHCSRLDAWSTNRLHQAGPRGFDLWSLTDRPQVGRVFSESKTGGYGIVYPSRCRRRRSAVRFLAAAADAFFARATRSARVMVSRLRLPPIFPPLRPSSRITSEMIFLLNVMGISYAV